MACVRAGMTDGRVRVWRLCSQFQSLVQRIMSVYRLECGNCEDQSQPMCKADCIHEFLCIDCIITCPVCGDDVCEQCRYSCARDDSEWHCNRCCRASRWGCAIDGNKFLYRESPVKKLCINCHGCYSIKLSHFELLGKIELCADCAYYCQSCQKLVRNHQDVDGHAWYQQFEVCRGCLDARKQILVNELKVPNLLADVMLGYLDVGPPETKDEEKQAIETRLRYVWDILDDLDCFIPWKHAFSGSPGYMQVFEYIKWRYSTDLMCGVLYDELKERLKQLNPAHFQNDTLVASSYS